MRRGLIACAVAGGAVLGVMWWLSPPARTALAPPVDPREVRGAVHVHTTLSDGAGTPEEVASAAAAAGLSFVVLTDHGDARRDPVPPRYVDGVLLIDAVELSTTGGHYLALGMSRAPYRLAGEPRDVIEDVQRLGGFGVAAHPDSPKGELSWREWQAPFDGLEWLNADSAWRDERRPVLARALAAYWLRAPETIASLFDRPGRTLARWDALSKRRRVVAIAGHDAHARIGPRGDWEPADGGYSLRLPSYRAAFRAFSLVVELDAPLSTRDAAGDAAAVIASLRTGRVATVLDALAGPARVRFSASREGRVLATMGGDVRDAVATTIEARLEPAARGAALTLLRDGAEVAQSTTGVVSLDHDARQPAAVYRVEALWPGAPGTPPMPWIVTNAIRVGFPAARAAVPLLPPARWERPCPVVPWVVEQHPASTVTLTPTILTPTNTAWTMAWTLGAGVPAGQYVAMAVPVPRGFLKGADRVAFTGRASGPMRVSIQVRSSATARRWIRSVYLSDRAAPITVALREMTPASSAEQTPLDLAGIDAILIVVDTVNTSPGSGGEVWVSELRVEGPD
jgi:hypothetical protein